ncbi:hypothetical protein Tco_0002372 [Tanacetum coccineum]
MSGGGGYYSSGVINENIGSEEEFMAVNNGNKRNAKMKGTMSDGLKKNVETTNRFAALNEVIEEDNETEWQRLKHIIDLACEIHVPIPNEEMLSWSKDATNKMVKCIAHDKANSLLGERMKSGNMSRNQAFGALYDKIYRDELAKIEELKWKKQMVEVDLFSSLNVPLTDDVKDRWTEEMIEDYEGILEERRNDVINGHWEQNYNEAMEEVAEETSAHAYFIVKNNVVDDGMIATSKQDKVKLLIREMDSSRGCRIAVGCDPFILNATILSQSDPVMHFLVSIITCQKEMFIYFIYGENDPKGRVALSNNLRAL